MCDYSIQAIRTRPAKVDDKLTVCMFGWSTRGFAAPEDKSVAVCLSPGTELSFAEDVRKVHSWPWSPPSIRHKSARHLAPPSIHRITAQLNSRVHPLVPMETTRGRASRLPVGIK